MKVPTLDTNVNIQTTKEKAGTVPEVISAAYGADVGQAMQVAGNQVKTAADSLYTHLDTLQKDNEHKDNLRRETAFRQDLNDVMYNPEDETITTKDTSGNDVEVVRKKGLMFRDLGNAAGVTLQGREAIATLKAKHITGVNDRQLAELAPALDTHSISANEQLVKHEVSQIQADMKDATESNLKQTILDIAPNRDPEVLRATLLEYDKKIAPYNRQFNPETQKYNTDEGKLKIVNSNIEDILTSSAGNMTSAQTYLDSVKDSMSKEVYNAASKNLSEKARTIETQKRWLNALDQETRSDAVMDKVNAGNLTFKDIEDQWQIPEEKGGIKKEVLLRYKGALESRIEKDLKFITGQKEKRGKKDVLTSTSKDAIKVLNLITEVVEPDIDKWKAREHIADIYADGLITGPEASFLHSLTKSANDIKFNRASGKFNAAIKFIKNKLNRNNATDAEIAIGIKALINSTIGGVDIDEGAKAAVFNHAKETNPYVSDSSEKGTLMRDSFGNVAIVYPDGRTEEYQPMGKARKTETQSKENK
jgi:hypothetical protein